MRRGDDVVLPYGERVIPPHEAFGPAERRRPHGMTAHLVVGLLHGSLLVLRRQQRQDRRDLCVGAPIPVLLMLRVVRRARIDAVPLGRRKILERIDIRAAAAASFLQQRLVVLLGGLEGIGADDGLARQAAVAMTPRGIRVRARVQRVGAQNAALNFGRHRAVAAEVALVAPQRLIGVEILAREDVDG